MSKSKTEQRKKKEENKEKGQRNRNRKRTPITLDFSANLMYPFFQFINNLAPIV